MRRTVLPALALVLGVVPLLSGCTAPPSISLDEDNAIACVDSSVSDDMWAGVGITNTGGATVLRSIDFGSLENMVVEEAWLMELSNGVGLAASADPIDIPQWGDWVSVEGAELAGDHTAQLVLHLRTLDPNLDALLRGVTLSYDGGEASSGIDFGIIAGGVCELS